MAVFGLVSAVAGFVKVRYLVDKAVIDNMVFRTHYRITSAIMFLCCIIVSANNLIGKHTRYVSLPLLPVSSAPTRGFPYLARVKVVWKHVGKIFHAAITFELYHPLFSQAEGIR